MKKMFLLLLLTGSTLSCFCWGFFAHKKINRYAVFLLPPRMLILYKPNIDFITDQAVLPDKRRYVVAGEAPRHYIDIDNYGSFPYAELPHSWKEAVEKFGEDTLLANGIVPWHVQTMLSRLTAAFREKNYAQILKNSAEIGHYIADAHVPLHASSNHNGQLTGQEGIHAFWESRVPELLAEREFDFFIGTAQYIADPGRFIWDRVLESAKAADSVLLFEKELSRQFAPDKKYAFENRGQVLGRQYSSAFCRAYNKMLNNMIERRMRESVWATASFWLTAWINAGQPDLSDLSNQHFSESDLQELSKLNEQWKNNLNITNRERPHE
jgi:hypothetical protein